MEFTVHLPGETEHRYHGEARFEVIDSGVPHVWPRDERRQEQVVCSPPEWLWVEARGAFGRGEAADRAGSEDDDLGRL